MNAEQKIRIESKTGYVADYSSTLSCCPPNTPFHLLLFLFTSFRIFDANNSSTFIHFRIAFFACNIFRRLLYTISFDVRQKLCHSGIKEITPPLATSRIQNKRQPKSGSKRKASEIDHCGTNGFICRRRKCFRSSVFSLTRSTWLRTSRASVRRKRKMFVFIARNQGRMGKHFDWFASQPPRFSFDANRSLYKYPPTMRGKVYSLRTQQVSHGFTLRFQTMIFS